MNDKSLIEDSEDAVSKGALLRDNSSNEANDSAPAKKTVRKTATDVAPKAAKVEKPAAAKSGKETAKKVAAKKTSEKKAQTVEPKPVKEKKTEAAKKIASAEKSTGKEEEAKAAKLTSAPMQEAGGKKSSTTGGPAPIIPGFLNLPGMQFLEIFLFLTQSYRKYRFNRQQLVCAELLSN
jgi:outer membrane biosynthesis protein TonB